MPERLVVIGGDAAGMSAASQARKRRPPADLEILAFDRGTRISYSACGIPYYVGGAVEDADDLVARTPEQFRAMGIDVRVRHEATAVDLGRREVTVRDLEGGTERAHGFDHLVVATGSVPVRPPLPGADAAGIFGVQVLDDGLALRRVVDDEPPGRAVVVGGGYIGLEMAEALVVRKWSVSLVDKHPHPMASLDPDMGALVASALAGLGVATHFGEAVAGFDADGGGHVSAVVTEARTLPADLVVLGLGVRPNVELARSAGVPVGSAGGVVVDRRMRTPVAGVWAAGDCVESFHRVSRRPAVVALGTHANKQGRVAGINLGGGYAFFDGVVGTAVSKVCDHEVARTGLTSVEATDAGFEHLSAAVDSTTRAGYYPGAAPIRTKLVVEKRTGRLLGAQIVGQEGAAKRIDVLATALWNEMTVEDVVNLDLSYAPPYAPVWDPVLIAARKAWEAVEASAAATM